MAERKVYHVAPAGDEWRGKFQEGPALKNFDTRQGARQYAAGVAKNTRPAR